MSRLTSQDPLGVSDLADTSIVGIPSLDNAPRNSESCKPHSYGFNQYKTGPTPFSSFNV